MKTLRLIPLLIVIAGAIYTAFYYYQTAHIKKNLIEKLNTQDRLNIEYQDITSSGFPYRTNFHIEKLNIQHKNYPFSFESQSIHLISHLWTPNHFLIQVKKSQIHLEDFSIQDEDILASYRHDKHEGIGIAIDWSIDNQHPLLSLSNTPLTDDINLFMALRFPNKNTPNSNDNLYGSHLLDLRLRLQHENEDYQFLAQLNGPELDLREADFLKTWQTEGGVLDINEMRLGTTLTGNATLSLNQQGLIDGSLYLENSKSITLSDFFETPALKALGINQALTIAENQETNNISLILQQGDLLYDGLILKSIPAIDQNWLNPADKNLE